MRSRIRVAEPSDAERIARVHIAAWQAGYAGQLPAGFLAGLSDRLPQRVERWREDLIQDRKDVTTLIAEGDETSQLFGFVTYGRCRDDDLPATTGELWAINLHPDAWGRGIGSALFGTAVEGLATKGFSRAVLWVLDTNARARRFYEKHGWAPDGRTMTEQRTDHVRHEVRYARDLTPPDGLR